MAKRDYNSPRKEFAQLYFLVSSIEKTLGIDEDQPLINDYLSFEGIAERLGTIALHTNYLTFDREETSKEKDKSEKLAKQMQKELCWLRERMNEYEKKKTEINACWRERRLSRGDHHRHSYKST